MHRLLQAQHYPDRVELEQASENGWATDNKRAYRSYLIQLLGTALRSKRNSGHEKTACRCRLPGCTRGSNRLQKTGQDCVV